MLTWSPCFALWQQIDVRLCYVFRVCIQELSQLHRSTGWNIGFSPYYCSLVKNYGSVLFVLQLTDTSVLHGQDRAGWNSSLLTSYVFDRVLWWIHTDNLKAEVSFHVDSISVGCYTRTTCFFHILYTGPSRCMKLPVYLALCSYGHCFGYMTLRCQMLLLHVHE
jgi:hypothetical protein